MEENCMSGIESIGPMGDTLSRHEEKKDIEPVQVLADDLTQAAPVRAAAEKLDTKTTTQGFQYTGKGAFIDGIF